MSRRLISSIVFGLFASLIVTNTGLADEFQKYYHQTGPLAGSLKSAEPLPVYDANSGHLWNRLFAALYTRPRFLPEKDGQPAITRLEGGDVIEFLAWGKTKYWSEKSAFKKLIPLLDEFLAKDGSKLTSDNVKRAIFQHDLWATYDHLVHQNILRTGTLETRKRREVLCKKLANCLQQLALSSAEIQKLPDTFALAVKSGAFVPEHNLDAERNYLPYGLLTKPDEWVETDFYQPNLHEDLSDRFVTLHTRSFLGRSYFRIFYRFPEGRQQLESYLKDLDASGVNWKQSAQNGFISLNKDAPALPVGTEVVLLHLMMTLDDQLRPVPTTIVEAMQFRVFLNIDGSDKPDTNTGVGINVLDYRMKRHLMFDNFKAGGLEREPEELPQYRVAISGPNSPDWGFDGRKVLFQQCVDCHMSRKLDRLGVRSVVSIVHMGGFNAGAQLGIAHTLKPSEKELRGKRVAKWKSRHESYRRLLEHLGR